MAYSAKHRYKSRQEKYVAIKRNTKAIIIAALAAIVILVYKNWQYIMDTMVLYF
jgi:hypothetical protein